MVKISKKQQTIVNFMRHGWVLRGGTLGGYFLENKTLSKKINVNISSFNSLLKKGIITEGARINEYLSVYVLTNTNNG